MKMVAVTAGFLLGYYSGVDLIDKIVNGCVVGFVMLCFLLSIE